MLFNSWIYGSSYDLLKINRYENNQQPLLWGQVKIKIVGVSDLPLKYYYVGLYKML